MPFSSNTQALRRFHTALADIPQPAPVQAVVRDCINHVLENARIFDAHVSGDSPFVKEFFATVKDLDTTCDGCFGVLECLVIFFREKTLRCPDVPCQPVEESLLQHFERSGHWDVSDDTLVTNWYWSELPQRYTQ